MHGSPSEGLSEQSLTREKVPAKVPAKFRAKVRAETERGVVRVGCRDLRGA